MPSYVIGKRELRDLDIEVPEEPPRRRRRIKARSSATNKRASAPHENPKPADTKFSKSSTRNAPSSEIDGRIVSRKLAKVKRRRRRTSTLKKASTGEANKYLDGEKSRADSEPRDDGSKKEKDASKQKDNELTEAEVRDIGGSKPVASEPEVCDTTKLSDRNDEKLKMKKNAPRSEDKRPSESVLSGTDVPQSIIHEPKVCGTTKLYNNDNNAKGKPESTIEQEPRTARPERHYVHPELTQYHIRQLESKVS
jgi:hypothetical protein